MEAVYDKSREDELMDILGVWSMDQVTIIRWKPIGTKPKDERYVLVKYYDPSLEEQTFDFGAYEWGVFSLPRGDGTWVPLREEQILGWAYPMFWSL